MIHPQGFPVEFSDLFGARRMLRVDQVLVIRHKVLHEERSVRSVAREFGVSRNTVQKYLSQAEPIRQE